MDILVKELMATDSPELERHLLAMSPEDRRLRFGENMHDAALLAYVTRIDFNHDAVFGVIADNLQLLGAAHLARNDGLAELGLSVLEAQRGKGIGAELLARAQMHAKNWGCQLLYMHCLSENGAILHLAKKQGMRIVTRSGETEVWLALPPADEASRLDEASDQRVALVDYALKSKAASARNRSECIAA